MRPFTIYDFRTRSYRTGRALQDAALQDGWKRLQDGQSPTGLLVFLAQLAQLDKLEKTDALLEVIDI